MHSKYSMRVYIIVLYIYVYILYISIIYTYRCAWQKPFCDRHILDQNWEPVLGKAGCPSDPRSWEIQSCEFCNYWSWPQTTTVVLWDGTPRNFMSGQRLWWLEFTKMNQHVNLSHDFHHGAFPMCQYQFFVSWPWFAASIQNTFVCTIDTVTIEYTIYQSNMNSKHDYLDWSISAEWIHV